MLLEVRKELSKFAKYVVKQSRTRLTKRGMNKSKELYGSLGSDLKVHKQSFSLSFFMMDYGMFVDEGVRGAEESTRAPNSRFSYKQGGKENKPSPKHFEKFAKEKGISPFAVAHSVWSKGTKPSLFFTKPFEDAFLRMPDDIVEKFGLDIENLIESTLQGHDVDRTQN